MRGQRQKIRPEQGELAFSAGSRSDAPKPVEKGIETRVAKRSTESLAETERRMEEVCERENCKQALQRVKANKGSPGVDGMTVEELSEYLKQHDPTGSYYAYFSVLDPQAPDRNFSVVGDQAFLYFVRLNSNLPDRALFRQPIRLHLNP